MTDIDAQLLLDNCLTDATFPELPGHQSGKVRESYDLPDGEYERHVRHVQQVELADSGEVWLVTAADSSLHWLDSAGQLIDRFDYGEQLTGVAMTRQGDATLLLVTTDKRLTAWRIQP